MPRQAKVHRPITCYVCKADLVHPDDQLAILHCGTCGNTWHETAFHAPLHREHWGEGL